MCLLAMQLQDAIQHDVELQASSEVQSSDLLLSVPKRARSAMAGGVWLVGIQCFPVATAYGGF